MDKSIKGLIFDIQGYAVHDGPGCRTLVFLSGCPLSCKWCSNPEGQIFKQRLLFRPRKCICNNFRCIDACSKNAIKKNSQSESEDLERITIDRKRCNTCHELSCISSCWHESLAIAGRWYTVHDVMTILKRDRDYWGAGGGVTFGGGEPFTQSDFLHAILHECQKSYIHTAVETSAYVDRDVLLKMLPLINWLFMDIKHIDPEKHMTATGVDNELILKNVKAVTSSTWNGRLIIRNTIIPGFNDSETHIMILSDFMRACGVNEVNLLPYHALGTSKYEQLGVNYEYRSLLVPSDALLKHFKTILEGQGHRCYVGSHTPF